MPAIAVIKKKPNDEFEVVLCYFPPDLLAGETISGSVVTAQTGLTADGSPIILGNEVGQMIKGGTSGSEYTLTFFTSISSGRKLEDFVIVRVLI